MSPHRLCLLLASPVVLGSRVQGVGFMLQASGLEVARCSGVGCIGLLVRSLAFRAQGSGFEIHI